MNPHFWCGLYISAIIVAGVYIMDVYLSRAAKRVIAPIVHEVYVKDQSRYQWRVP